MTCLQVMTNKVSLPGWRLPVLCNRLHSQYEDPEAQVLFSASQEKTPDCRCVGQTCCLVWEVPGGPLAICPGAAYLSWASELTQKPAVNTSHRSWAEPLEGSSGKAGQRLMTCPDDLIFLSCYSDIDHRLERAPCCIHHAGGPNLPKSQALFFL